MVYTKDYTCHEKQLQRLLVIILVITSRKKPSIGGILKTLRTLRVRHVIVLEQSVCASRVI